MPRAVCTLAVLLLTAVARLAAQDGASSDNPGVSASRMLWETFSGHITTAAEELPEAKYAYQPTPEVRTFGQLVGHVAGAQYLICAAAMGEPPRQEDEIEKSRKTKAELVAALKASTQYCARAYQQSDQAAGRKTKLFGQERTRMYALVLNAAHDSEHYGNIVTYLRINGIVPPSSRRQ